MSHVSGRLNLQRNKFMIDQQEMRFEEFDAQIESVDGRTLLRGREESTWKIHTWVSDDIILQSFQEGGANSFVSAGNKDYFSLGIGLPGPSVISVNGNAMDPGRMIVLRPDHNVVTHSSGISRYVVLSIPRNRFISAVERFDPSQTDALMSGASFLDIGCQQSQALISMVSRLMDNESELASLQDASVRRVAQQLSSAFVQAASSPVGTKGESISLLLRRTVTDRIIDLLHSPDFFDYSIPEMAALVGVPVRTFRLICTERFGTSPGRLVMFHQYNRIRRDLLHASKAETVSQIAGRHGIWEWGRFAVRYRQFFGESPSDTLAR